MKYECIVQTTAHHGTQPYQVLAVPVELDGPLFEDGRLTPEAREKVAMAVDGERYAQVQVIMGREPTEDDPGCSEIMVLRQSSAPTM